MIGEAFKLLRERSSVVTRGAMLTATRSPAGPKIDRCGARFKSAAAAPKAAIPSLEIFTNETQSLRTGKHSTDASEVHINGKNVQIKPGHHQIIDCVSVNEGKQLELTFADQSKYRLHTAWIKDSSPANTGKDYYRKSASAVWDLNKYRIADVSPSQGGSALSVQFKSEDGSVVQDELNAKFLHSFAPFVGQRVDTQAAPAVAHGTSSLFDTLLTKRKGWKCDVEVPQFDAEVIRHDVDTQAKFLETMATHGVAQINGLKGDGNLPREEVGKPLEDLIFNMIGRFNQHPIRSTRYGVITKRPETQTQGSDYDMSNPLSMHTDHTVYHGTPGYLQFLWQAEGSVRSKVVDGVYLAAYMKENHPDQYKLLTEVHITHSSRNNLYTTEGAPRNIHDPNQKGFPFELVHTHPVIQLDANGRVEKVVQSETKRGVSALPYDIYEPFMEAYENWVALCEDDRFVKYFDWPEGTVLVTNNWQTLHGRASVAPEMKRTMIFAYQTKVNIENRYRLLRQKQTERDSPAIDSEWMTRVPNQVLEKMVS